MFYRYTGILVTALALAAPLTCAAAPIEFDRNGNGTDDIMFGGAQDGGGTDNANFVHFDNNEDGTYDFGFQGGCNGSRDLCALWIDKNGNGEVQKNEVRKLHSALPWATFPSSFALSCEQNGNGIDYFMDYTDDSVVAREIGRDLNGDGDIERDIFLAAEEAVALPTEELYGNYNLIDRNNDGFFDTFESMRDGFTVERFDLKKWSRHLPVLTFAGDSCLLPSS